MDSESLILEPTEPPSRLCEIQRLIPVNSQLIDTSSNSGTRPSLKDMHGLTPHYSSLPVIHLDLITHSEAQLALKLSLVSITDSILSIHDQSPAI
eukprot:85730-Amorphochlora_amoeboformis.AAC.1